MKERGKSKILLLVGVIIFFVICVVVVIFFFLQRENQTSSTRLTTNELIINTPSEITNPVETVDIASSWVYVTNTLRLVVMPGNGGSTCSAEWHGREPGKIELYTRGEAGEKQPLAVTITDTTCFISKDINTVGYVGISIDGEDVGGLEAPLTSDDIGGLMHMMFALPDNPTTVYPTSGIWSYSMTASTDNLNCSIGSFTRAAGGQVTFTTTDYGLSATMNTSANSVFFSRQAYSNPYYESPDYGFPTGSTYGSVRYGLQVIDQEHMSGTLHMEGDVCTGDYPITLELITPTVPPIYVPRQGSWNIQYGPLVCGGNVIDPTTLFGVPFGVTTLSVTGGGPVPMQLNFSGVPSNLSLMQSIGTNEYNSFPNLYLGIAIDPITHTPFTLMGTWNVSVLSETQIMATLSVIGTNGCVSAAMVQLQQI